MRAAACMGISLLLISIGFAQEGNQRERVERRASHPGGRSVLELPKGFSMKIMLETRLDSRTTQVGDPVRASLESPIIVGESVALPQGTILIGKVANAEGPKMGVMKAKIEFLFTGIKTRSGTHPIEATVHMDMGALATQGGKAAGGMVAKEVAKRAIPVLGTVFLIQDIASGVQFVTEDKEIVIPCGTEMKVTLDKEARIPLTF